MAPKRKVTFIVYAGDNEVLVTTPTLERKTKKQWFTEGRRDPEEYSRTVLYDACVEITSDTRFE